MHLQSRALTGKQSAGRRFTLISHRKTTLGKRLEMKGKALEGPQPPAFRELNPGRRWEEEADISAASVEEEEEEGGREEG